MRIWLQHFFRNRRIIDNLQITVGLPTGQTLCMVTLLSIQLLSVRSERNHTKAGDVGGDLFCKSGLRYCRGMHHDVCMHDHGSSTVTHTIMLLQPPSNVAQVGIILKLQILQATLK